MPGAREELGPITRRPTDCSQKGGAELDTNRIGREPRVLCGFGHTLRLARLQVASCRRGNSGPAHPARGSSDRDHGLLNEPFFFSLDRAKFWD